MDSSTLKTQKQEILRFGQAAALKQMGGFGRLRSDGTVDQSQGLETWINARMAYCYALEVLGGNQSARANAELGLVALSKTLHDQENDGWVEATLGQSPNDTKAGYAHAFVLLASSALTAAGIEGAEKLLDSAKRIVSEKYWSNTQGACVESYNADWSVSEDYRGANSNMHMVEAFLACFDQTGEQVWLERALSITDRLLNVVARGNNWRLVEHFDANWNPQLDYNQEQKAHPFRPYGGTIGHWFEWSRLAIELKWALEKAKGSAPDWLQEVSVSLFDQGISDGWAVDGNPGFVYTVDWEGNPVVAERMSWVVCEALSAAYVLSIEVGKQNYEKWIDLLWEYSLEFFHDKKIGNWHMELDSNNLPSTRVWKDRPDIYHLYQTLEFANQKKAISLISSIGEKN